MASVKLADSDWVWCWCLLRLVPSRSVPNLTDDEQSEYSLSMHEPNLYIGRTAALPSLAIYRTTCRRSSITDTCFANLHKDKSGSPPLLLFFRLTTFEKLRLFVRKFPVWFLKLNEPLLQPLVVDASWVVARQTTHRVYRFTSKRSHSASTGNQADSLFYRKMFEKVWRFLVSFKLFNHQCLRSVYRA